MNKYVVIGLGIALLVTAFLAFRRAARYDLKGLVVDAAWQAAKARGRPATPTELETRARAFQEAGNTERAKMAAGAVGGHFLGKLLQILAWILALSGFALAAIGAFWMR